jgi:hypothetical protein
MRGLVASSLTAQIPGERDRLGRLSVDAYLRVTGVPDVYAAGDIASALAEEWHYTTQSCQHAQPMGKFTGHNVAADLLGTDPLPFTPDPYGVCLDLGPAGAVVTQGWDRAVRMTGEGAKALKRDINTRWIHPPVDGLEQILAQAGRDRSVPPPRHRRVRCRQFPCAGREDHRCTAGAQPRQAPQLEPRMTTANPTVGKFGGSASPSGAAAITSAASRAPGESSRAFRYGCSTTFV